MSSFGAMVALKEMQLPESKAREPSSIQAHSDGSETGCDMQREAGNEGGPNREVGGQARREPAMWEWECEISRFSWVVTAQGDLEKGEK